MDINHLLGREEISLHNARIAATGPARLAHEGLAKAYGRLLADSAFPHRSPHLAVASGAPAAAGDERRVDGDGAENLGPFNAAVIALPSEVPQWSTPIRAPFLVLEEMG